MSESAPVRVTSAEQSASREAAAIAAGAESFTLMRAAGEATASFLLQRVPELRERGARVFIGTGNNGGDAWVVAGALARAGCPVSVDALGDPKSADAQRARSEAKSALDEASPAGWPACVIDGILGTGTRGEATGEAAQAIARVNELGTRGTIVVALDVPSGLDASTGGGGTVVRAGMTCTYGTLKRGLLLRRDEGL